MSGITVVHVRHVSAVAAIQTAEGPRRLLEAGLEERLAAGGASVEVVEIDGPEKEVLGAVGEAFAVADAVARAVREAAERGRRALVLAGSCQVGLGGLSGTPGGARGVVWLDAHGDFNTPSTTGSGLVDATVLATLTGRCWQGLAESVEGFTPVADERVALLGARSLDPGEERLLDGSRVAVVSPATLATLAPPVLRSLGESTDGVYLHVDLDVLDAREGKANAWAGEGGLSRSQLLEVVEQAMALCPVRTVGFASYDPAADEDGAVCEIALELAEMMGRGWEEESPT